MAIPDRVTFASVDPRWAIRITDDGSPTLVDHVSGDSMHSGCGAVAETKHVYLLNSGIQARIESGQESRVLEVGLGSGMGFLLTAELAHRYGSKLHYVALENNLASGELIEQLDYQRQGVAPEIVQQYCHGLRGCIGSTTTSFSVGPHCVLTIEQVDAASWSHTSYPLFDAVYFDPYSPETSPTLWTESVFMMMRRALTSGGRLVSYCVNRKVRDTVQKSGFEIKRVPGPVGGKREVLIATAV